MISATFNLSQGAVSLSYDESDKGSRKAAFALLDELRGYAEKHCKAAPQMRANAPSGSPVSPSGSITGPRTIGPIERAFIEEYGATRVTSKMQAAFGLSGTREEQIGKLHTLLSSGEVVKTATGYKAAGNGGEVIGISSERNALPDIDVDECV